MRRLAMLLLVAVLAAGCRGFGGQSLPSAEARAAYGNVAVTSIPAGEPEIGPPVAGWAAGLGMGTVRGIGAVVVFAGYGGAAVASDGGSGSSGEFGMVLILMGMAAGAAVGAVYAPVSIVAGAATAPPPEDVQRAELVIRPLAEDPGLGERFCAHFVESARQSPGAHIVDRGQETTRVELRILRIGSGKTWNWFTFDRPFGISIEASASVVRVEDGAVLWTATRTVGAPPHEGAAHTYVEWAADEGELLRLEIDDALEELAAGFAASVFEGTAPPEK
jgi:hypothetical protein